MTHAAERHEDTRPMFPFIVGTLAGLVIAGGAAVFAKQALIEDAQDRTSGYF